MAKMRGAERSGQNDPANLPAHERKRSVVLKKNPGESEQQAQARLIAGGLAHNVLTTVAFSEPVLGETDLGECFNAFRDSMAAVKNGDLRQAEEVLMSQALALNALFARLVGLSRMNIGHYPEAMERFMRLALKAQSQSRATLETLATIKNPPTVFARQANIAHGPQQVNNSLGTGPTLPRAAISERPQSKLLEARDEQRLELGAKAAAQPGDPALAAVGAVHRTANS